MDLSAVNLSAHAEAKIVREQLEQAYAIFQREAMAAGESIMCELHEAFGTFDTSHHNCLGCNLADSTDLIDRFLQTYTLDNTIQYAYTTFIILAYLLVERMDSLFNIVQLNEVYRSKHFGVLREVRRWANFLKHPKAFLLTHHPTFSFESSPKNRDLTRNANVVVDRNFVAKYYTTNKHDNALFRELENKENVLVIFPSVVRLAEDLCKAMQDCVALVGENPVYREVLADRTTFYDYWIDSEDA